MLLLALAIPTEAAAQMRIVASLPARPATNAPPPKAPTSERKMPEKAVLEARFRAALAATAGNVPAAPVPFYKDLEPLGCRLLGSSHAGVELVAGGLNGTATLMECGASVVALYYFDYSRPMTQRITIVDPEYAADPATHRYRIKQGRVTYQNGSVADVRWIHSLAEAKAEIFDFGAESGLSEKIAAVIGSYARSLTLD